MVGLITFHCQYNFGSALQAYALSQKLDEVALGGCSILNYYYEKDMRGYDIRYSAGAKVFIFDLLTFPKCYRRKIAYQKFHQQYFKLTKQTRDWRELTEISKPFDTLICGIDQIWNLGLVEGVNPAYFLKFSNPHQKKIAYAPSMPSKTINEKYAADLKNALEDFAAISVREEGCSDTLSKVIGREVSVVLDPTLLVEKALWDSLIQDYNLRLPKKYIFVYSLHQMNLKVLCPYAEKLAEELNAEIVYFNKYDIPKKRYAMNIFTKDPRAFVAAIKNAEFVVGDSFHASVFSIIFHKKFMSYSLDDSRLRLDSLFSKLGITGHFLGESDYQEIDYGSVEDKLKDLRNSSVQYLKMALER